MNIDIWQMMGSIAALAFTVGFMSQLRLTYKTRNVDALSRLQWIVFASASAIFIAYYTHLDQWLMVAISVFGTCCCLAILFMIYKYRRTAD
ncbi:MAG: hypothetical protein JKY87_01735 [Mariprofundus sp.]|nr:hypothetical protein [Mariprofundus sp.]